jgi:hypothetical protein
MHSSERVAATLMAMDKASASAMVPALRGLLQEQWDACDVQLLVADYRFRVLQPVEQPNTPVPVDGTAPGRAFRSQQPDLGPAGDRGVPVRLPVTVRGERLGVLQLNLPAAPGAEQQRELAELATAVGAVRDALIEAFTDLPAPLRGSLTWDSQGKEMSAHAELACAVGMPVFFCDPHSPWQRGSNENMNGLLRDYFPKAPTSPSTQQSASAKSPQSSTTGLARP